MNLALRRAWTGLITAIDLDDHMREIGQAGANALLLQAMLAAGRLSSGTRVLIAGAGTAQFLDYISGVELADYNLTLSDINPIFSRWRANDFAGLDCRRPNL